MTTWVKHRRLKTAKLLLTVLQSGAFVDSVHIVFDSDLNRHTLPGTRTEQTLVTRAITLLDSPMMHLPKTLCKAYVLEGTTPEGESVCLFNADENHSRRLLFRCSRPSQVFL